jgi:hypothetical protein
VSHSSAFTVTEMPRSQPFSFAGVVSAVVLYCLCGLGSLPAHADTAGIPANGRLDFSILRNGDEIGRHEMIFARASDGLRVDIKTHAEVKILFVSAYRFDHEGHEIWREGRLDRLWSSTFDDGTNHILNVGFNSGDLIVDGDGKVKSVAGNMLPASLWHHGIVSTDRLLNTLDGRVMAVRVENKGVDEVEVRGRRISAHHFALLGDLERELWFTDDNMLVKVRFAGSDGSEIQYLLR